MSYAARRFEVTAPMEDRIARLEAHTQHLQEDVKRIDHKVDALALKVDALKDALTAFQLETREQFARFQLETREQFARFQLETQAGFAKLMNARWADKVWWLVIAGVLLGVMARGFKWI